MDVAEIHGELRGGTILVQTKNVRSYEIHVTKLGLQSGAKLSVRSNGRDIFEGTPEAETISIVEDRDAMDKTLHKNPNLQGPIQDAFSHGFLVIMGSGGSHVEKGRNQKVASQLVEDWRNMYFVNCQQKVDRDVNESDISRNNLILLGNAETNTVIKRISPSIPIRTFPNAVKIGEEHFSGNDLGFAVVYPNPLKSERYVVIIGTNNPAHFFFPTANPWLQSTYDYIVWKQEEVNRPDITAVGYFDSSWRRLISAENLKPAYESPEVTPEN